MLQQNALILAAGLVFLFFFSPGGASVDQSDMAKDASLIVLCTLSPGLLSYILARRGTKNIALDPYAQARQWRITRRLTLLFGMIALVAYILEVYYLHLPAMVGRLFGFLKLQNIRIFIAVIPLMVAILLIRLSMFEVDRRLRNSQWSRTAFLSLNVKLMVLPLLPFVTYLIIGDMIDHSPLPLKLFFIANPYIYWIMMFVIIIAMYAEAAHIIRRIWATYPLPEGEIRNRIEQLARKENIKYRDILVWDTEGGRMLNAATVGLLPFSRYIFLTDSLLRNFTADEIEGIAAHELGHMKYRHPFYYLVFSIAYFMFYAIMYALLSPVVKNLHLGTAHLSLLNALVTLAVFYLYFIFIFRFLSRRFERQADLFAITATGDPDSYKSALSKLAALTFVVKRSHWILEAVRTHPSVPRRLAFVDRAVAGDPAVLRYSKSLFGMGWALALALAILVMLFVLKRDVILPTTDIHYELGRQYAIKGMNDNAILEFRKAVRADPSNGEAHFALGVLYARKGVWDKAESQLQIALRINPQSQAAKAELERVRRIRDATTLFPSY